MHSPAALRILAHAGLWSALAFALNLAWEIAHVRLYTIWAEADRASVGWALLHCSLGDVVIALAMFALAGMVLRRVDWPASHPWAGGAMVVIGALAFTAWSEWYNVYRTGAWSYTSNMPTVYGVGLSPLLQWLILPPVILVAYRALRPVFFGEACIPGSPDRYDRDVQQKDFSDVRALSIAVLSTEKHDCTIPSRPQ